MNDYDVYGLGAALVDTEISVTDESLQALGVTKGVMELVDEARQQALLSQLTSHALETKYSSGGSAANTIIANSSLGGRSYYSCKVARDAMGDFYLNDLQQAGVSCEMAAVREDGITGKCLVLITPDAQRSMNTFLGISETLSVADLNL